MAPDHPREGIPLLIATLGADGLDDLPIFSDSPDSLEELVRLLDSPDPEVRIGVAWHFGDWVIVSADVEGRIRRLLEDEDGDVRVDVGEALVQSERRRAQRARWGP